MSSVGGGAGVPGVGVGGLAGPCVRGHVRTLLPRRAGPKAFEWGSRRFKRTDLSLLNARGQRLQCCHWEPEDA